MKLPEMKLQLESIDRCLEHHDNGKPYPGPRGMPTKGYEKWLAERDGFRSTRDKLIREIDAQEKLLANKPFAPVPPSNEPAPVEDGPADHLAGTDKHKYVETPLEVIGRVVVDYQELVRKFHVTFDIHNKDTAGFPDDDTRQLRISLIQEECNELVRAISRSDMVETADGMADLMYVVFGTALSLGIDLGPIFLEVQRSNMSKLEDGKVKRRDDGKVLKGKDWSPPALAPILKAQGWEE